MPLEIAFVTQYTDHNVDSVAPQQIRNRKIQFPPTEVVQSAL